MKPEPGAGVGSPKGKAKATPLSPKAAAAAAAAAAPFAPPVPPALAVTQLRRELSQGADEVR